MLKHIPFYASLLNKTFNDGSSPSTGMILVYGAIEAHSFGERGCIASNKTIAEECGLKATSVANAISALNREGWIRVELNENNHRVLITPLLEIVAPPSLTSEPPFTVQVTPLHSTVNIEYSNKNTVIEDSTKVLSVKTYGKQDIQVNEVFDYWEKTIGIPISSRIKQNRIAASNLIKKYDTEKVCQLINGVLQAQEDRYAPRIADFCDLQSKLTQLLVWGRNRSNTNALPRF